MLCNYAKVKHIRKNVDFRASKLALLRGYPSTVFFTMIVMTFYLQIIFYSVMFKRP
jgi:hypothetical protein